MDKIIILLFLGVFFLCCDTETESINEHTPTTLAKHNDLEETWRYDRPLQPILASIFWENSTTESDTAKFTSEKGNRHIKIICMKKETNEYYYQGTWDLNNFIETYK